MKVPNHWKNEPFYMYNAVTFFATQPDYFGTIYIGIKIA